MSGDISLRSLPLPLTHVKSMRSKLSSSSNVLARKASPLTASDMPHSAANIDARRLTGSCFATP